MNRWILRSGIALGFVGVVAALLASATGSTNGPRDVADAPERATGSSEPSPFPPLDGSRVRAVRTGNGLVLPLVGGEPGAWQVRTPCAQTATVDGAPLVGAHLVLDPGHGGTETGAIGPTGMTEADLNLDVAHRVAQRLGAQGAAVVLTRTSDVRITLQTRAELAVALDPLAFISIHHNAVPVTTSATPGSELYHQLDSPEGTRLSGLLWEALQQELAPFGTVWGAGDRTGAMARRSLETGDDYYGVLRRSQGVPAVLVEATYLSEAAEAALLDTEEFRAAEAEAIADAFVRYVTTDDPGSGFGPPREVRSGDAGGGGTAGCDEPPLG